MSNAGQCLTVLTIATGNSELGEEFCTKMATCSPKGRGIYQRASIWVFKMIMMYRSVLRSDCFRGFLIWRVDAARRGGDHGERLEVAWITWSHLLDQKYLVSHSFRQVGWCGKYDKSVFFEIHCLRSGAPRPMVLHRKPKAVTERH